MTNNCRSFSVSSMMNTMSGDYWIMLSLQVYSYQDAQPPCSYTEKRRTKFFPAKTIEQPSRVACAHVHLPPTQGASGLCKNVPGLCSSFERRSAEFHGTVDEDPSCSP